MHEPYGNTDDGFMKSRIANKSKFLESAKSVVECSDVDTISVVDQFITPIGSPFPFVALAT